ncbi:OsmC family protein [Maridesulfovibrio salexigens]|uniref:OsmC family protein n=1 Tax=Maridesulfovibrio salexigens (strain ATCC 14822 / DSM 2638 / NCIMB 8403 / VKM B-1763) TaxID=526222 RepID=C6BYV9_MARSD|nr:OsmC family protein [Maridesulfovibrio salexigens]ACS80716.1 OsmC family protein [Maridesulfovibrio salexigens DSM 2638]
MNTVVDLTFKDGMQISAKIREHEVLTDVPADHGGADEAQTPFELFFSSLACCAGVYAKRFFESKNLSTDGFGIRLVCESDPEQNGMRVAKVNYEVTLPKDFPEKYEKPLMRTIDQCTVKKQVLNPPEFEISFLR